MRTLLFCLLAVAPMAAATITQTIPFSVTDEAQACGSGIPCAPLLVDIPQWNPATGTLKEVDWTFLDTPRYRYGYNDMYEQPGLPFVLTYTVGDTSAVLGLGADWKWQVATVTTGTHQFSGGGIWSEYTVSATGTAPDLTPFIGTGVLEIAITPFALAQTSDFNLARPSIYPMHDNITGILTYVDDPLSPVPEPRWVVVLLILAAFMLRTAVSRRLTIH